MSPHCRDNHAPRLAHRIILGWQKLFRLGKNLAEAYRVWADRIGYQDKANTVGQLLDRYTLQVVPTKEPPTRAGNLLAIATLRKVFGDMPLGRTDPQTRL